MIEFLDTLGAFYREKIPKPVRFALYPLWLTLAVPIILPIGLLATVVISLVDAYRHFDDDDY